MSRRPDYPEWVTFYIPNAMLIHYGYYSSRCYKMVSVEWSCKLKRKSVSLQTKNFDKICPQMKNSLSNQCICQSSLFLPSYVSLKEQGHRPLSNSSKMRKQLFFCLPVCVI